MIGSLGWIAWVSVGAVIIAAFLVYGDLRAKKIKNDHEYRMKRLEYDEKAVDDAERAVTTDGGHDGKRTLIAWIDGDRYVFRDGEVDHVLALGAEAPNTAEAWDSLADYGKEVAEE